MSRGSTRGVDRIPIESVDDPRLAEFYNLRNHPAGRQADPDHFVVEGQVIVGRLIASGFEVRSVVMDEGRDLSSIGLIAEGTPVYVLSRDQMRSLTGFDFHRGFLASARRKPIRSLDDFRPDRVSLALVQTTDMENLGSMLRSAAAFGINQVLIDNKSVDPFSRRAMRVSMGAALGMRYLALTDPERDLRSLGDRGVVSLAATVADDSVSIVDIPAIDAPVLIVMGNEANGLPGKVQEAATRRVTIPMGCTSKRGSMVDSLNVSVAAAILMHQLTNGR
jgi:tRNA G18 (ribose-2'-O)-methylase SpoU